LANGNSRRFEALSLHGKNITRPLETSQSAQACGEEVQSSVVCAEIGSEGAGAPGRAAVSQPRGQHAHGIEGLWQENGQENGEENREENDQEANG
jgi:hypothetical protein